jgi:hypothetical protein
MDDPQQDLREFCRSRCENVAPCTVASNEARSAAKVSASGEEVFSLASIDLRFNIRITPQCRMTFALTHLAVCNEVCACAFVCSAILVCAADMLFYTRRDLIIGIRLIQTAIYAMWHYVSHLKQRNNKVFSCSSFSYAFNADG